MTAADCYWVGGDLGAGPCPQCLRLRVPSTHNWDYFCPVSLLPVLYFSQALSDLSLMALLISAPTLRTLLELGLHRL